MITMFRTVCMQLLFVPATSPPCYRSMSGIAFNKYSLECRSALIYNVARVVADAISKCLLCSLKCILMPYSVCVECMICVTWIVCSSAEWFLFDIPRVLGCISHPLYYLMRCSCGRVWHFSCNILIGIYYIMSALSIEKISFVLYLWNDSFLCRKSIVPNNLFWTVEMFELRSSSEVSIHVFFL